MTEHTPPHNLDAEESLLGAMLTAPVSVMPVAISVVKGEDFYRGTHGMLFDTMVSMYHDDENSVDVTTLSAKHPDEKDFIHVLAEACPTVSNTRHYARIVKDLSVSRSIIRAGNEIAELGYMSELDTEKLVDTAQGKLIGLYKSKNEDTHNMQELGDRVINAILSGEKPPRVSTGFKNIDEYAGGLHAGALTIVGARPGVGKTCLGLSVAQRVAKEAAVMFFSMEMRAEELHERLLANVSCVSLTHMRERMLSPDETAAVMKGQSELEACNLTFVDNPGMSLLNLKSKVRAYVKSHNVKLVIVDYLQLMSLGMRAENRREEVSQMSRELKSLAMELNIHIMALSQLNRVSTFDGTKVDISQLKESGSLEQDADMVWLISWPKDNEGQRFITVDIAKNRNGPLGAVDLVWLPAYQRYEE